MRRLLMYGVPTVLFVLVCIGAHEYYLKVYRHTASEEVASHPMPRLFEPAALAPYAPALDQQTAQATRLMRGWWSTHDTTRHDRQFAAWLRQTLPTPPSGADRTAETQRLATIAKSHDAAGTSAAQWLQRYAGRDLWEYYEVKQAAKLPKAEQRSRGRELRATMTMAKQLGARLTHRLRQPTPFVIDPSLRPTPQAGAAKRAPDQVCPCSYPSAADASGAAGRTFLGYLYPAQRDLYRHMTDELAYAHLYEGNHLPSDVDAGTLLGDMVGEYFLVTRGEARVSEVAASS